MTTSSLRGRARLLRPGAVLLAIALLVTACGGGDDGEGGGNETTPSTDDTAEPVYGGDLTYGIEAETDGLNPTANNFAIAAVIMGRAVFDPLTQFDSDGVAQPFLAESLTPNDDFTAWDIKLRPGITFHDGTPLTSEAIKVHFESMLADPLVSLVIKLIFKGAQPVTIVDDLTARVALAEPDANFPSWLTAQFGFIGSPKWIEAAKADPALNQHPVGTGPFMYKSRQLDSRTVFAKNPNYWQEGLPYLDSVTFVVATDGQTRAQNLKAGDFDIMHTTRTEDIVEFRDDDAVEMIEDPNTEEGFLMMNEAKPPFDDPRARKAIAHATDRDQYVQLRGSGITEVANSVFAPGNPWYTEIDSFPEHDVEKAKEFAADYCADVPAQCEGGKIKVQLSNTPSVDANLDFDLFREQWKDVAVLESKLIEQANYIVQVALGEYQITAWRQYGALDPDYDTVWLDSRSIGPISINWPRINEPEIDRLLKEQRQEPDFEARKEIWAEINDLINENTPYIWLDHTIWAVAFGDHVHDVGDYDLPDGSKGWPVAEGRHNIAQIWVDG